MDDISTFKSNPFKKLCEEIEYERKILNDPNYTNINISLHHKYTPKTLNDLYFHIQEINDIKNWLNDFNNKKSLQKGLYLSGLNGIGKSSYIKTLLHELNYNVIEFNYNDSGRNIGMKEFLEKTLKNNINVFFKHTKKAIIIDELENIITYNSNYIKEIIHFLNPVKGITGLKKDEKERLKSQYLGPIICICNSRSNSKFKDLIKESYSVQFKPIPKVYVENFSKMILLKESVKINKITFEQIISIANGNISQLLCIIQYILLNKSKFIENNKFIDINELTLNPKNQFNINETKLNETKLNETKLNENIINNIKDTWKLDCDSTIFENMNTLLKNSRTISFDDCHRIYEIDSTLIPTMINDNCIEYSENISEISLIMDSFSNYDIINTYIFSNQCWNLYNVASLYSTIIPIRKMVSKNCIEPDNWQLRFCEQSNKIFQKAQCDKKLNKLSKIIFTNNIVDLYHWSNVLYQKCNQFVINNEIDKFYKCLKNNHILDINVTDKELSETSTSIKLTLDDLRILQPLFKNLKEHLNKVIITPKKIIKKNTIKTIVNITNPKKEPVKLPKKTLKNDLNSEPVKLPKKTLKNDLNSEPVKLPKKTLKNDLDSEPVKLPKKTLKNDLNSEPVKLPKKTLKNDLKNDSDSEIMEQIMQCL
jgi:DNA polymerase III delta prime subunit